MSWFSRVTLIGNSRDALRRLHELKAQPYAQHQALWRLFDQPPGTDQPFVFRQMAEDVNDTLRFLIVSEDRPSQSVDQWQIESKPYLPQVKEGERYRFSVRLNPTRSEKAANGRGKRQDYVISRLHQLGVSAEQRAAERQRIVHEELPKWLGARGASRGFEVERCVVERFEVLRMRTASHPIALSMAEFSGSLCVTDPGVLSSVLRKGMGHGRSFGLGLLLLKPW